MTTLQPALDLAARAAVARAPRRCSVRRARFREGHFLLKSGRHGDAYVEKFAVLSDPAATSELCGFWAARVLTPGRIGRPSTSWRARRPVASILAFETARQLGLRGIFAEEVRDDDGTARREFRRGFRIEPGERVLLVDDILTTGGSLLAMIPAVEAMGGEIVECVVLVDRSGGLADPDLADDRPDLPAARAVAARPADVRAGPRPARAAPPVTRSTRPGAPGRPPGPDRRGPSHPEAVRAPARRRDRADRRGRAHLRGAGGPDPGPRPGPRPSSGSSWPSIPGARRRPRVHAPIAEAPADFDLSRLENGAEFPPGHLVEHQATAERVRVWYREDGGVRLAIRLEDAGARPASGRRLTSSIAASSSSSLKISMNEAVTTPWPSTTKTHG